MARPFGAVSGGVLVAASLALTNVGGYLLTVLCARVLGTRQFGAFAGFMGLVLVVNVVSLGLQATTARRISVHPDALHEVARSMRRLVTRAAWVLGLLCLAAAPLLAAVLRLGSPLTAAALAPVAAMLTLLGGQLGILQGSRRWAQYSAVVLSVGVSRLVLAGCAVVLWSSTMAAAWGVALAMVVPVLVGTAALRGVGRKPVQVPGQAANGLLSESAQGTHTLAAFFVLSSADILLSRAVLGSEQSGLYAAGLIVTKAVLFAPSFVSVVVFPRLARDGARHLHLRGLAVILAMGGVATAVVAALPRLALAVVGGEQYAAITGHLWWFAALGTALAGIQLLVTTALARRHAAAVWCLWGGVIAVASGAVLTDGPFELLALVMAVDLAVLLALIAVTAEDEVVAPQVSG